MKTYIIQQEILLVTSTTVSQKQLCEKDDSERNRHFSPEEQLERACWNGFLDELIPEFLDRTRTGKKLFLWHIRQGASMLQIKLSESTLLMDRQYSIDPYFFLSILLCN